MKLSQSMTWSAQGILTQKQDLIEDCKEPISDGKASMKTTIEVQECSVRD